MANESNTSRRFNVALSFSGENRSFVEEVAENLGKQYGQDHILYDRYHDSELARPNLDVYLPNLYLKESDLIAIFLCPAYADKTWCKLEWRYIKQLICTADTQRIMFFAFGNPGDLSELGILPGDGCIDIKQQELTPQVVAERIVKRLTLCVAMDQLPNCFLLMTTHDDFLMGLKTELKKHFGSQLVEHEPGEENQKTYRDYLDKFLASPQGWLLTNFPPDQQDYFTTRIFPLIHNRDDKKFIFFESGADLLSEWVKRYRDTPPFVVIETNFESAARKLLEKAVMTHLCFCTQKLAVVTLLPEDAKERIRNK